jgi:hypothetical protein
MPRFFFHVHDDLDVFDAEGTEFPDAAAATEGAIHSARSLMCETIMQGRIALDHRIEVMDEKQALIGNVLFRDAVKIEGGT